MVVSPGHGIQFEKTTAVGSTTRQFIPRAHLKTATLIETISLHTIFFNLVLLIDEVHRSSRPHAHDILQPDPLD
jgi:hypothetical protein